MRFWGARKNGIVRTPDDVVRDAEVREQCLVWYGTPEEGGGRGSLDRSKRAEYPRQSRAFNDGAAQQ